MPLGGAQRFAGRTAHIRNVPDGRALAIAVFVTDSTADDSTRESLIAQIAKAAYAVATR
jgi:hypothetical protein